MKAINNLSKIYLADWLIFKPNKLQSKTDVFYLNICNKVFNAICNAENKDILNKISKTEVKELCCFLTTYFEDIISETGVWKAFITKHFELYKTFVVFNPLDEYYENEINLEDIQFLIWYFISSKKERTLVSPNNEYIKSLLKEVYAVFDKSYDYAPVNQKLKDLYFLDPNETDYYKIRYFMEKVFFNNYLLHFDITKKFLSEVNNILNNNPNINLEKVLFFHKDSFLLSKKSKLLAMQANEWAAAIVGKDHKLYNDLLNISPKINGKFLFKNKIDNKYIYIEHIATGKKFNLLKSSYESYHEIKNDNILEIGIIKWQNEWWFSGLSIISTFNADIILDEKNSIEKRHQVQFLNEDKVIKELLKLQYETFLKFNNNLPVAFLKKNKINDFINRSTAFYKKSLRLSTKEIEDSEKRAKEEGCFLKDDLAIINIKEDFETAVVYFNPNSGLEIYFDNCSAINLKSNPYFKENEFLNENLGLLIADSYTTEYFNYCYEINKGKIPFLDTFSKNQIDFLLRFYKSNNYKTIPKTTTI